MDQNPYQSPRTESRSPEPFEWSRLLAVGVAALLYVIIFGGIALLVGLLHWLGWT